MEIHITNTNIDNTGRIVIPKVLRDEFGLAPGTPMRVGKEGGRIILSPEHPRSRLKKKHGLWVISGDSAGTISQEEMDALLDDLRERREDM